MTTFYCFRFETPPNLKARSPIYIPQEQGGPVIPSGTGSLFVSFYDLQGYDGSIRPLLHMGDDFCQNNFLI
jgi:hypothetical protein